MSALSKGNFELGVAEMPANADLNSYGSGVIGAVLTPNFDIPSENDLYEAELYFQDANGQTFHINSILRPGVRIINDDSTDALLYAPEHDVIKYGDDIYEIALDDTRPMWRAGDVLTLLHEAAHSELDEDQNDELYSLEHRIRRSVGKKTVFESEDSAGCLDLIARERRAWAHALNSLRETRITTGINLEPELTHLDDYLPFVHSSILSYERVTMDAMFKGTSENTKWQSDRRRHAYQAEGGLPRNLAKYAIRPLRGWPISPPAEAINL